MSTKKTSASKAPAIHVSRAHRPPKASDAAATCREFRSRHAPPVARKPTEVGGPASLPRQVRDRANQYRWGRKAMPQGSFVAQTSAVTADLLGDLLKGHSGSYASGVVLGLLGGRSVSHRVSCVMGYACEDMLALIGEAAARDPKSPLVALRTGVAFKDAVSGLRKQRRNDREPDHASRLNDAIRDTAEHFLVTQKYLGDLVRATRPHVTYPDLAVVMRSPGQRERLLLAETKVGGRNDCKSTKANVEAVVSSRGHFASAGRSAQSLVLIAFGDPSVSHGHWRKFIGSSDRRQRLDDVVVNEDVIRTLTGLPVTVADYERYRREAVVTAAELIVVETTKLLAEAGAVQ